MTDWVVWPLFALQFFIFSLYFTKMGARAFGIPIHFWIIFLMLLVDVGVVVSLFHDSTDKLNLFF